MTADAFYDPKRGFAGGPRLISFDPIEVSSSPGGSLSEGITRNIRAAEVVTGVDLTRASIADFLQSRKKSAVILAYILLALTLLARL